MKPLTSYHFPHGLQLGRIWHASLRKLADSWDLIYLVGLLAYAVTMMIGILDQSTGPLAAPIGRSYSAPM